MTSGTFAVSRRIWTHPEFAPCEFSEREAFLWLVSEASWKDRTIRAGRVVVDLQRGQLCASIRFMAEAWQWSKSRVDRFLKRLENRDMLRTESGTGQLVITLCNYDEYQGQRDTSGTQAGQSAGHERDTSGTNYKKDEIRIKKEEEGFFGADAPKAKRRKPEVELPEGWVPNDKNITDARERGFSAQEIDHEADRFRDYHAAKGSRFRDWDAAWRSWLNNARKFGSNRGMASQATAAGYGQGGSIASIVARRRLAGEI